MSLKKRLNRHYLPATVLLLLLSGPLQADRIAAGDAHNLAARADSSLYTWGAADNYQLGDGTTLDALNPIPVVDQRYREINGGIAVVAHGDNSIVLLDDATLLGWGPNENGQLGSGLLYRSKYRGTVPDPDAGDSEDSETDPESENRLLFPTVIVDPEGKPLSNITAVALGENFAAAVNQEGNVLVWGNLEAFKDREQNREPVNRYRDKFFDPTMEFIDSRYKDGDPVDEFELLYMTDQLGNRVSGIVAVAVGDNHLLAQTSTGKVLAWGENSSGQLGDGTLKQSHYAVAVRDEQGVIANIISIAAVDNRSWAITANGDLLGWGNAMVDDDTASDDPRSGEHYAKPAINNEGEVINGLRKLAPGASHILALTLDGRVIGWGSNSNGQLGDGTNSSVIGTTYTRIANGQPLSNIIEIAIGSRHSLALAGDGRVYAWGAGENGELGDGTNVDSYYAVNVRNRGNTPFSLF